MRRAGWASVLALELLALVMAGQIANAQTSSSSRPLSGTVVGTYVARNGELTLLVLWRGASGWFMRGTGGSAGGGGGSAGGRETGSVWFTYGDKSFSIDFDYTAGAARLLGQDISLADTNVVLVDNVDSASGARVIGRQRVDPKLPERTAPDPTQSAVDQSLAMMRSDPILAVIRRTPALSDYLQCDLPVQLPDSLDSAVPEPARARRDEIMRTTIAIICRQATGP